MVGLQGGRRVDKGGSTRGLWSYQTILVDGSGRLVNSESISRIPKWNPKDYV